MKKYLKTVEICKKIIDTNECISGYANGLAFTLGFGSPYVHLGSQKNSFNCDEMNWIFLKKMCICEYLKCGTMCEVGLNIIKNDSFFQKLKKIILRGLKWNI